MEKNERIQEMKKEDVEKDREDKKVNFFKIFQQNYNFLPLYKILY